MYTWTRKQLTEIHIAVGLLIACGGISKNIELGKGRGIQIIFTKKIFWLDYAVSKKHTTGLKCQFCFQDLTQSFSGLG